MSRLSRYLPFSSSITAAQAITYLCGISLFSISFLVFLNSSVSFVITDIIGQKEHVGDAVGTLGFADEVVALVACPVWGVASDRLGVRWVAVLGYWIIGLALVLFVQAKNVYPQLLLARIFFALGASAAATMVTATLPLLTKEEDESDANNPSYLARKRVSTHSRHSIAFSVESEATITPESYTRTMSGHCVPQQTASHNDSATQSPRPGGKSSALAGYVGLFTGCGALVALSVFLPLPASFGEIKGVTQAQAVAYSFYVVGVVAVFVAGLVFVGFRNLKGEEDKGWATLFQSQNRDQDDSSSSELDQSTITSQQKALPYFYLLRDSILLGFTDSRIALGYIGGFVARASTVAISLFIPLFINTYFISHDFCQGSPNDPSPELKKECRSAYILSSILTGVAQLAGLLCAPIFGYLSSRCGQVNYPIIVATVLGMVGYIILPQLASPEFRNVDDRGGNPVVFVIVICIGISQIGAIVCSLGSLGQGVLATEAARSPFSREREPSLAPDEDESAEDEPLLGIGTDLQSASRVQLKGSIAGVYSLSGGAAILILTKVGGVLFDKVSKGAPFYMMAGFNGVLLVSSLLMDASRTFSTVAER